MEVIVFGGNHHNTLGVIRSLGREGVFPVVLLHDEGNSGNRGLLKSKYIKYYKLVSNCIEGIDYLNNLAPSNEKRIIICCSDDASSCIDENRNILSKHYLIPCCAKQGEITRLMNKQVMGDYSKQVGFFVPSDVVIKNGIIPEGVVYPCITKPIKSIYGSKDDIKVCGNREELEKTLRNTKSPQIQAQHFIAKEFEYQLIGCSLNGGEEIIIPGRSRIITQPTCTNTGFLKYEHLDGTEPIEECKRFIRGIKYSGLFSMEFLRGIDRKDYFMEINFRNDGNSICVTEAGVNLSFLWYAYNSGLDWKSIIPSDIKEIYVMPEFTELGMWYIGDISFARMIKEFKLSDVYMDFATDDPKPTHGKFDFIICFFKYLIKKPARKFLIAFNIKK